MAHESPRELTTLVPAEMALAHAKKRADDEDVDAFYDCLEQANAFVLHFLKRDPGEWTAESHVATDREFGIVQAAILRATLHLWRFRGDDEKTPDLTTVIFPLVSMLRDPSLA